MQEQPKSANPRCETSRENPRQSERARGAKKAFVVHGADAWTRSPAGESHIAEVHEGVVRTTRVRPEDFGEIIVRRREHTFYSHVGRQAFDQTTRHGHRRFAHGHGANTAVDGQFDRNVLDRKAGVIARDLTRKRRRNIDSCQRFVEDLPRQLLEVGHLDDGLRPRALQNFRVQNVRRPAAVE
jgi:hypothetical protein